MKNILFFLLLSSFALGQNFAFKNLDSLQFKNSCKEIIKATNSDYKIIDFGALDWKKYEKYENSKGELFYFVYFTKLIGENKDLEKKGVKKWFIDSVASKYLTIFELYKKYYNQSADIEKIQKLGQEWNSSVKDVAIRKTSQEGLWEIKVW